MTTLNDLYPGKYLKAEDFEEGATLTLTITGFEIEEMGEKKGKKENKPVLYFQELDKGLVLNKTNANLIAEYYGEKLEGWTGKTITLFTMEVESFGDIVRAIRVKKKPEKGGKAKFTATPPESPDAPAPVSPAAVAGVTKGSVNFAKIGEGFAFKEWATEIATKEPYYNDRYAPAGKVNPDMAHIRASLAKLGIAELNAENAEEAELYLLEHARSVTEKTK